MTSNDPLYQLIKTLSGTEKRYFKLNANKQDGKKDYLELFDFIDKQKEYNEAKLKEAFKKRDFIKHISVVKNYLFNAIIDSLHEFSTYDTAAYKIDELQKKIEVLYQKGLIDLCLKYIDKAKKMALDHECFLELIKILEIQHQISIKNSSRLFSQRKEIQYELKRAIEVYYNYCQYVQLQLDINDLLYRQHAGAESTKAESQLQHDLLAKRENALSSRALELYLIIHSRIHEHFGEMEKARLCMYELLKNYEKQPALLQESPLKYARAINGYLQSSFDAKEFEYFNHYLNVLKNLLSLKISTENKSHINGMYYVNLFIRNIEYGLFKETIKIAADINNTVSYNTLVPAKIRTFLLYQECIAYIGNEEYKHALKLINTTLTTNENLILVIKRVSKLLGLVVLYELSNIEQLENEIISLERATDVFIDNEGEKLLLKYMKKNLRTLSKKETVENFENLKRDLIYLSQSPSLYAVLRYFDFLSWVESKIQNLSFASIIQTKAKRYPSI